MTTEQNNDYFMNSLQYCTDSQAMTGVKRYEGQGPDSRISDTVRSADPGEELSWTGTLVVPGNINRSENCP